MLMMRLEFTFLVMKLKKLKSLILQTNQVIEKYDRLNYLSCKYVCYITRCTCKMPLQEIQDDLVKQHDYFKEIGKHLEAKRLKERTEFDLEMIRELGYCSGIENYSRYLDGSVTRNKTFLFIRLFSR